MKTVGRLAYAIVVGTLITACGGNTESMASKTVSAEQLGQFWVLETLNGSAPVGEVLPNIAFNATDAASGQLGGNNGCNRYFTNYTLTDNSITMEAVGNTMMLCPPEAVELERQYMTVFGTIKKIEMDGKKLVLTSEDGKNRLVFTPQEKPVEPASDTTQEKPKEPASDTTQEKPKEPASDTTQEKPKEPASDTTQEKPAQPASDNAQEPTKPASDIAQEKPAKPNV